MKLHHPGLARAVLVAGTAALALAFAAAPVGLSPAVVLTSFAALMLGIIPLSQLLAPGTSARQRYLRHHRPLAGPRPGAWLG